MRQPQRRRNNNNNVPLLVDYSQTRATLEIENQFKKNNKRINKKSSSSNDSSRGGTPRRGRSPVKNTKPRRVRSGGSFGLRYLGVNSRPREPTINGPTDAETTALLELQNLPLDGEEEDRRKSSPGNIMFSVRLTSLGVDHLDDLQVSCSEMNLSCQCRRRMTRSSSSDDMMMMSMMDNRRRSASLGPKRKSLRRIKSDNSCATTASTATTTASGRTRQLPTLPTRSMSPSIGGGSSHRRRRSMSPLPQKAPSNSSLRSGSDHSTRTTRGLSPSSDHERRQRQERRTSLKLSGLPSIAQESSTAVELEDASNRSLNLMLDASTNSLPATATPMSASFSKRRARFMNRSVSFEGSATGENSFSMTSSGGTTTTTRRGGRRISPKRSKSTTKDKLSSSFNLSASFNTSFRLGGGGDDSMRNSMNQSWTSMKSHDMNSSFSFISGSRIRIHTASQQVSPEAA